MLRWWDTTAFHPVLTSATYLLRERTPHRTFFNKNQSVSVTVVAPIMETKSGQPGLDDRLQLPLLSGAAAFWTCSTERRVSVTQMES